MTEHQRLLKKLRKLLVDRYNLRHKLTFIENEINAVKYKCRDEQGKVARSGEFGSDINFKQMRYAYEKIVTEDNFSL